MRKRLIVLLCLALGGCVVPVLAQSDTGTLVFNATVDEDGDGNYTPALCAVSVYPRIEGRLPGNSVNAADLPVAPIVTKSTGTAGTAEFDLPPGEYSVRRTCSHDLKAVEVDLVTGMPLEPICCPAVKAKPRQRVIKNEQDEPALVVQDVTIVSGEITTISAAESPDLPPSTRTVRTTILLWLGAILAIAVVSGLWRFRPRYDPKSDPNHPKRLEPKDPDHKPADFDRAFGDFLKKK